MGKFFHDNVFEGAIYRIHGNKLTTKLTSFDVPIGGILFSNLDENI
jgi:hypothetical protein